MSADTPLPPQPIASSASRLQGLRRLLRPRDIAFIGGTQASGGVRACLSAGFRGRVHVVNPVRESVAGIACVPRIADLPEAPDAALVALSPERCVDALRDLAAIGSGGAVCISSGFAEVGGRGAALQHALLEAAGGMAIVGPNCLGILNLFDGAAVWGTDNHMGTPVPVEGRGVRGCAIVSQSGALLYGISNVEQGFPLGYGISTGNQAQIDAADCIDALLEDPRVAAIGLYLEGIVDGAKLGAACLRAGDAGIPIVALKGGDTRGGEEAAISHTGAIVVERDLWEAFAARCGLVEVPSPKALVETLKFLTVSGVPRGARLSAVTFSGGANGLVAARAPRLGLSLPPPSPAGRQRLRNAMPETVTVANPLDLNLPWHSSSGLSLENGPEMAAGIADLAADVADMVVFFVDLPRPHPNALDADWLPGVVSMDRVRDALDVPCAVAGILPEGLAPELRLRLLKSGVTPLLGLEDALQALSAAARVGTIAAERAAPGGARDNRARVRSYAGVPATPDNARMLDEAESKARLGAFGLAVPGHWSGPAAEAANGAQALGYPVALKVLSDRIAHKAALGGVRLHVASEQALREAIDDMASALPAAPGGHVLERVFVERMVCDPQAEFIIGIKRHPGLGLALMLGRGGAGVEHRASHVTMLLPLEEREVDAALTQLAPALTEPGATALRGAIRSVAAYAEHDCAGLLTLDVNPVVLTAAGEAFAVDALIVTAG